MTVRWRYARQGLWRAKGTGGCKGLDEIRFRFTERPHQAAIAWIHCHCLQPATIRLYHPQSPSEIGLGSKLPGVVLDRFTAVSPRIHLLLAILFTAVACSDAAPTCPFTDKGDSAPSAGCFAIANDGLLLVQDLEGNVSLPGGSSEPGESAQCTAFRETWEETGLRLHPTELIKVFDTGFHLYRCEKDALSGTIDPPPRLEVQAAFYLPAHLFHSYDWRFEDQRDLLQALLADTPGVISD